MYACCSPMLLEAGRKAACCSPMHLEAGRKAALA